MAVDLRLLHFDLDNGPDAHSHTVLSFQQDYELFDFIEALPQLRVPKSFFTFCSRDGDGETHYGNTQEAGDDPLTYTTVEKLLTVPDEILSSPSERNKAVFAYLKCLDVQNKVALFWH